MSKEFQTHLTTLRSLNKRIQPDQAWVARTRETLLMQARNSLSSTQAPAPRRVFHIMEQLIPRRLIQALRGPAMALASVLVVVLGGSVASVSAAERSLPGDFFYTLKLATEQARLAFTNGREEKLKLKIEFTTRRVDELKRVAKADAPTSPQRVIQAAEILKRDLNTVKAQLDDVKKSEPKDAADVAKLVDQKTTELVQVLQETKSTLPAETKGKVTEVQAAAADASVKAIEVMVEKHQEAKDDVSATDVVQAIQDHSQAVATVMENTPFMTTSSVVFANAIAVTTSTSLESATATQALEKVVEEIKTATTQAFAAEKAATASSTASGIETSTSTSSESAPTSTSATPATSTSENDSKNSSASSTSTTPP